MGHLHRLIAFDLDGTLIDSRRDLADSANDLIVELGAAPLSEEAIGRMVGDGAAALVRRVLRAAGRPEIRGALARFLEIYDGRLLNHTRLYDGIADVIRFARRHARLAVLTNKPLLPTARLLEALAIRHLFDEVVAGDGPDPRKPDPTALRSMMAAAGATGETTLVVGDSAVDQETARRASARCCLVSYGFGFCAAPPREELSERDWVADDVAGLQTAIEAFVRLAN